MSNKEKKKKKKNVLCCPPSSSAPALLDMALVDFGFPGLLYKTELWGRTKQLTQWWPFGPWSKSWKGYKSNSWTTLLQEVHLLQSTAWSYVRERQEGAEKCCLQKPCPWGSSHFSQVHSQLAWPADCRDHPCQSLPDTTILQRGKQRKILICHFPGTWCCIGKKW